MVMFISGFFMFLASVPIAVAIGNPFPIVIGAGFCTKMMGVELLLDELDNPWLLRKLFF